MLPQRMLSAIKLNHQLSGGACEVRDVGADRMLAAETMVGKEFADCPPQTFFDLGCITPQPARRKCPLPE